MSARLPILSRSRVSASVPIRSMLQDRWVAATPRTRAVIQTSAFLGVVLGAYNYTFTTLLQNVGLETPLAYVSLVPALALFLAVVKRHPERAEPPIYDRQLDYIVGVPLVLGALAINSLLPRKLSVMFWVWRIDLLSLPLFVAGVIAIVFGVRVLWRQKLAVGFLVLAWPMPYSLVLLGVLNAFTNLTIGALRQIIRVVHVATPVAGTDDSLFRVLHHGSSFELSVVSACSGVNSVVGFLLIGALFGVVVHGPRIRKTLWLIGGMVVIWGMNLVRLVFIFWAGQHFGEHTAISILHPFVGLVTFALGVMVMVLLIRPLKMSIGKPQPTRLPSASSFGPPDDEGSGGRKTPIAVPKIGAAFSVVAVAGIGLGVLNAHLRVYNLVANSAGEPTLTSFNSPRNPGPVGFDRRFDTSYNWATPYFGDASTWNRYSFTDQTGALTRSPLATSEQVYMDVIDTTDLNSFSAYGIEACYTFHGYTLRNVSDVNLGGGITGQSMAYQTQTNGNWSIVYWIVPVVVKKATHYERIVLYLLNTRDRIVRSPLTSGYQNLSGALNRVNPADRALVQNRNFLVTFARDLIAHDPKIQPRLVGS